MTRAAIQGVRGAFSHAAAVQALGEDVDVLECRTFDALFRAVLGGDAEHGVVPVENTLAGSVQRAVDLLVEHPLHAVAEARIRVRLCLIAPPDLALGSIRRVASHPVALDQCRAFFDRHPEIEAVTAFDTAGSVRDLMAGAGDYDAAIGSELAASLYGAAVLERDLEDNSGNYTRFLIIALDPAEPPRDRAVKTSLVLTLAHRPGALHRALGCFAEHGVDLSRIESRPIPGRPWEYRFHIDLRGSSESAESLALAAVTEHVTELRVLGRYPEVP